MNVCRVLAFVKSITMVALISISLSKVSVANERLEQDNKKLQQLQDQIKKQQEALNKQIKQQNSLQDIFKATELKVAQSALKIAQTQRSLRETNNKIIQLNKEQRELTKKKKQQQSVLAEMVRTAYLNGKHDYSKLLLNQEDPAQLERLITYYRKLKDARVKQLDDIQAVMRRLVEVQEQLLSNKEELAKLQTQQETDKKQLLASQMERKAALNKLNRSIKSDKQKLEQLKLDEQRLANAIIQAQQNATRDPAALAGLYNLKKQLNWPTRGRLTRKFGQRRSGALRWKGVVIDGNLGARVNAIADGVVLYSDWLKGFGWLTVVDHGKGYMSLYGHNQALLKQAGDYVEQNEPIALVGQSGGQSTAGLYFEIRYKGKTVNPARWCR